MKYSVVIPLYNGARSIEKTLDTVLAQTYKNYEIILVNDDSPDNVGIVVKKYIATHPGVEFVYVEQKNKGLGGARNTAIRHSSGDVIAILDQDDLWYPNKLERVTKFYKENQDVSIMSHDLNIQKNGEIIGVLPSGPLSDNMHRALLFRGNCLATPAVTFKKALIEDIGSFSENTEKYHLIEDYELWMRIARAGYRFCFIPEILGEYAVHDNNYSFLKAERMCKSAVNVVNLHYNKLKTKRSLDWYRLRHRRATLCYIAAFNLFYYARSFNQSIKYLIRALGSDPFLFFQFVRYGLRKMYKIIMKREKK